MSDADVSRDAAFFVVGGTVPPGSPSYVERAADRELFEALRAGDYCFVLNARQMGKSSLAVRTIARLADAGIGCAFVDLTRLGGSTVTPDQWYSGLLVETGRAIGLRTEAVAFLRENRELGPAQRYLSFLQEFVIENTEGSLVLMIDEIDAVRSLSFSSDELFAGIRHLHNARASNPSLNRLTVCLLGAALPSDLMSDPRTTPFNIGKRIGLRDFTADEAKPLSRGLGVAGNLILGRVLYWTAGHPFLTQVLCADLASKPSPTPFDVDRLVRDRYLGSRARDTETNLADLANRLLGRGDPAVTDADRADTLVLYRQLLRGGIVDDESNPAAARIKMSGAARVENGRLVPRNRIYSKVFGRAWIAENMPGQEVVRQQRAFRAGAVRTGIVGALLALIIGCFALIGYSGARIARASQHKAMLAYEESRRLASAESAAKLDALRSAADARRSLKKELEAEAKAKGSMIQEHVAKLAAQRSEAAERTAQRAADRAAADARASELEARRLLYASNMGLASAALSNGSGLQLNEDLMRMTLKGPDHNARGWEFRYFEALLHEAQEFPKQVVGIRKVAFSPGGRFMTLCTDNRLLAWDPDRPRLLSSLSPLGGELDLSSNGRVVAQSRPDGSVDVRSPEDFALRSHLRGIGKVVQQIGLSEDGSTLIGVVNSRERVMNLATGEFAPPGTTGTGRTKIAILPGGDGIEPRNEGLIRVRFSNPQNAGVVWSSPGRGDTQRSFAVSQDGQYAAFSDSWGYAQLVDTRSGRWIGKPLTQSAMITAIAFAPDSSAIVTGSDDGVIKMSRVPDGTTLRTFRARQGHIATLALAEDGRIGYGTTDGFSGFFATNRFDRPSGVLNVGSSPLSALAVSRDGKWLATAAAGDESYRVVDARTGKLRAIFPSDATFVSLDFSPDGKTLAVFGGGQDTTRPHFAELLDLRSYKRRSLKAASKLISNITFSPDGSKVVVSEGSTLATNSYRAPTVQVFDAATGRLLATAKMRSGWCPGVAFSSDGRFVAVPHGSGATYLQDAATLKEVAAFQVDHRFTAGIEGDVCSAVCFGADGRTLLVGRNSGVIDVYDIATRSRIAGWGAHTGRVTGIAYVRGKGTLVTASDDRHVKFWEPGVWRNVGEVLYPTQVARLVASTADDSVYVADGSGNVHALRTVGLPPPPDPKLNQGSTVSWESILAQAKRSKKPVLLGIFNSNLGGAGAYRAFLESPEIKRILSRHFILADPAPTDTILAEGRVQSVLSFFNYQFDLGGTYPWTKLLRPDGTQLWDGQLSRPPRRTVRVNVGAPQAPWEIDGYLAELKIASPGLTQPEVKFLREMLQKVVSPTITMTPDALQAVSASHTDYDSLLERNDLAGALQEVDRLMALEPMAAYTHGYRGRVLCAMERWREAADEFQRNSGVVRPDIDEHFWQMMSALFLADDRAEFLKRLESVVEPDWELLPTDALSLECLGFGMTVGLRNPRFVAERIERRFAQELSNPAQVLVKADFALVLARAGRLTEAEKWIRQALASPLLSTMDRDLMNHKRINLALILALRGDRTGARAELARAEASLGPLHTDGQLLSGVGVANLAMGRAEVETRSVYAVVRREVNELLSSR